MSTRQMESFGRADAAAGVVPQELAVAANTQGYSGSLTQ